LEIAMPVVTRFRPLAHRLCCTSAAHVRRCSTGFFAKHTGGTMLLRIEDTDRERSTDAATRRCHHSTA
jgi:glutamyl-tRNA synthetase